MKAKCRLLLIGLHKHGIGLDLLNEFLGSLGEHGGLVHGAHEIDLLSIESLGQMNQSGLEAVLSNNQLLIRHGVSFAKIIEFLPVTHSIVEGCVEVSCADEHMTRECGAVVGTDHALVDGLVPVHSVCHFVLLSKLLIIRRPNT